MPFDTYKLDLETCEYHGTHHLRFEFGRWSPPAVADHGTRDHDHQEDDVATQIAPESVPFWQKDRRHPEHQEFNLPTAYIVLQPHQRRALSILAMRRNQCGIFSMYFPWSKYNWTAHDIFWMSLKDHGRGILVLGEIMEANLVCTHSITVSLFPWNCFGCKTSDICIAILCFSSPTLVTVVITFRCNNIHLWTVGSWLPLTIALGVKLLGIIMNNHFLALISSSEVSWSCTIPDTIIYFLI